MLEDVLDDRIHPPRKCLVLGRVKPHLFDHDLFRNPTHKQISPQTPARSEYGRPPMGRHPGDSYDDDWEYGNRERHSRRSRRDRTPSRSRSRSAPRSKSGIRHKVKENFDGTERGLASGAVGAIAGGFVGHQVGKGPLATVAGVLLGGLGANAWEAREARYVLEALMRFRKSC